MRFSVSLCLRVFLCVLSSTNTTRVAIAVVVSPKVAATRAGKMVTRGWVTDLERGHERVEVDIRAAGC